MISTHSYCRILAAGILGSLAWTVDARAELITLTATATTDPSTPFIWQGQSYTGQAIPLRLVASIDTDAAISSGGYQYGRYEDANESPTLTASLPSGDQTLTFAGTSVLVKYMSAGSYLNNGIGYDCYSASDPDVSLRVWFGGMSLANGSLSNVFAINDVTYPNASADYLFTVSGSSGLTIGGPGAGITLTSGSVAVPEPVSFGMAAVAGTILLARRRKA